MFNNVYKGKKVLVTGNTGFKGSWLTTWLLKLEADVYGLSDGIPTYPSMFETLKLEDKITYYEDDIRDLAIIARIIDDIKPDFVFHLAGQAIVLSSYEDPIDTITRNVVGTANVLEALRLSNHACVAIIITSDKCYDNVEHVWGYRETDTLGGKDVYGGSKGAAELIIKSYYHSFFSQAESNIQVVSARAGNVVGGGDWAKDRIVPDCMKAWSIFESVEIRSPNATRPWQHVLEPLSGYLTAGMYAYDWNLNGQSFNFGPLSQYNQTVKELIKNLSDYFRKNEEDIFYRIYDNAEYHEAKLLKLNCDKALIELKWTPTLSYDLLIEFTGSWYRRFYNKKDDMFDFTLAQINEYDTIAYINGASWTN